MSVQEVALNVFGLAERAELLGAIYGDGSIERRNGKGDKVSVGVSDQWPLWRARVPELFDRVFGRHFVRTRAASKGGVTYYEYHVTTHDLHGMFGITEKYGRDGRIVPPAWVAQDTELLRRFVIGLVETDGCFSLDPNDGTPIFQFSQENDCLAAWLTETLCRLGYPCYLGWHKAAGVNQPRITQTEAVKRFGEWLDIDKWHAIRDADWSARPVAANRRDGGTPVRQRERKVLKTVPVDEQDRWRQWRTLGASIVTIARHAGRSNSVIQDAVGDIVPERVRTAEDLGLKPLPRYPRESAFSTETVERWRASARSGLSSREISDREGVRHGIVEDAVADIRWDQLVEKRVQDKAKLGLMMTRPNGTARWLPSNS